ncbi:hypothetical protein TVAG_097890 [Trichomonas vaginalis G3]|uniref:Raptor N-terminal CASPase-like domain-containing protein n=1 Tax=Trichomonas vaginalis (strain ATCC PRA-98 / G3) TaxID=412133 RepID=A2E2B9_TRIV3|nr:TOR signaling [Trichomonas vaginalis G3]EAY13219.1 hypothetical protein TVAG_097890 [Trichomonas vaginalis G3]KAI5488151.1 TOR signaling [Trichomonas vaginalis G3]|eukprot:XP_001325442.1 hypothetical protein [Trichomonas vaginalis G3]
MSDFAFRTKKDKKLKESDLLALNPYSLWRHSLHSVINVRPEIFDTNATRTDISVGIVAVSLYHLERNMRWSGLELSSRHYCWTDMKNRDPASISDIVSYQICHNLVQFAQESVLRLSDPSPTRILTQLKELSHIPHNKRCLFIYNGHGAPEPISASGIMLSPDESLGGDQITARQLITSMPLPSCFIFDADFSGLLFDDFSDPTIQSDRFGFFSCGPKENLPHRIGLPSDLFTSCLLTPAFVAMLWGSRQFYAFTSGGLHEFPLSYFSDENGVRPHLHSFAYEIERLLTTLVHAMAYSMIPADMLYNCFFRDAKVGKLFVNFCLARRIGAEIGFKPMCYPAIPDFSQHILWEYFDLYLDRVLLRLTQMDSNISVPQATISGDFSSFLADALTAIEHILDIRVFETIPNEISLLPLILSDPSLAKAGIKAVTRFIDIGEETIRNVICSGMMPIMISMPYNMDNDLLLPVAYCLAKMQSYALTTDSIIRNFTKSTLQIRNPLFETYKTIKDERYLLIALVLMTVGMHMEYGDNANDIEPEIFKILVDAISSSSMVVAYWAILYLSEFLQLVPEPRNIMEEFRILEKIQNLQKSDNPEIRAVCIAIQISGIDFESEIPEYVESVFERLSNDAMNDPSIIVRTEILILLQRFLESENCFTEEYSKSLQLCNKYLKILINDPHQEICDLATALLSTVNSKIQAPTGFSTSLLIGSIHSFLASQFSKFENYTMPPFCLQSTRIAKREREDIISAPLIDKASSEYNFIEVDHYKHHKQIVTKPFFLSNKVICGDIEGNILVRNTTSHEIEFEFPWQYFFSRAISPKNLKDFLPMSESSVMLTTSRGDVSFVNNITLPIPKVIDSFSILQNESQKNQKDLFCSYKFSHYEMNLFCSCSKGILRRWDISSCNFLNDLNVCDSCINNICLNRNSSKSVLIASDDFRVIDLRQNNSSSIVINTPSKVTCIHQSLHSAEEFFVVLGNGNVMDFDIRFPQTMKQMNIENAVGIESLAWAPLVIAHTKGIEALDLRKRSFNILNAAFPNVKIDRVDYVKACKKMNVIEAIFNGAVMSTIQIN